MNDERYRVFNIFSDLSCFVRLNFFDKEAPNAIEIHENS